jgi:hypothetical protein
MKTARIMIHGFVLGGVTVFAILVGYAIYRASGMPEQVVIQVLAAGMVCVSFFAFISWVAHRVTGGRLALANLKEFGITYATAFLWSAALFALLHLVTQGYLTSVTNVLGIWLFQFPFTLLALLVANGRLLVPEDDTEDYEYGDDEGDEDNQADADDSEVDGEAESGGEGNGEGEAGGSEGGAAGERPASENDETETSGEDKKEDRDE